MRATLAAWFGARQGLWLPDAETALEHEGRVLPEEFGAAAVPALSAINLAMLLIIDDRIHSDLLTQPVSCWNCIG